jgi:hypothetical protein
MYKRIVQALAVGNMKIMLTIREELKFTLVGNFS